MFAVFLDECNNTLWKQDWHKQMNDFVAFICAVPAHVGGKCKFK